MNIVTAIFIFCLFLPTMHVLKNMKTGIAFESPKWNKCFALDREDLGGQSVVPYCFSAGEVVNDCSARFGTDKDFIKCLKQKYKEKCFVNTENGAPFM